MYAFNGINGLGGLAGAGLPGAASFMPATGSFYDPAASLSAMGGMGSLALPKDPLARSTMLAQMAAEKAVLTSRKRKLIDSMV